MRLLFSVMILLLLSGLPQIAAAQQLELQDGSYNYRNQNCPAVQISFPVEQKTLARAWRDYLRRKYDVKLKGIGILGTRDLLSAVNAPFPEVGGPGNMDFFTHFAAQNEGIIRMSVFASIGDTFIGPWNQHAGPYQTTRNIVGAFLSEFIPDYYAAELKNARKEVDALKKALSTYRRTIERNERTVLKLQKENKDLEERIREEEAGLDKALRDLEVMEQRWRNAKRNIN
ncbi:MAG: hypothetical protein H6555_12135 [Lewinellaceae bacterium]|nr:hypothetical protein [Lewinellaceae bacterium]MCB9082448.1 hypothetical protein [Lewinellaceae bacterium]